MKEWWAPSTYLPYSINEFCAAFWDRYPNSFSKHIVSEDVLERRITDNTIFTKKLIVKQGSSILKRVPKWLSRMTEIRVVPVIEESLYDKRTQTLTTYTRNVAHLELFYLHERVVYKEKDHGDHGNATEIDRAVSLAFNSGKLSSIYEKVTLMGFKKSIANTTKGLTEVLEMRFGARPHSDKMSERIKQKILNSPVIQKINCEKSA
ncbi:unnamed protein product, partial [Mesorhabditis spiculigera]